MRCVDLVLKPLGLLEHVLRAFSPRPMGYQAGGPLDVVKVGLDDAFYFVRCAKKLGHLEENHPSNSNLQKSTDCQKRCGLN